MTYLMNPLLIFEELKENSMKIALYVAHYNEDNIQTPPSLEYLAGYLVGSGLVKEEDIIFADNIEQIIAFEPQILGVGSLSQTLNDAKRVATKVKEHLPCCWSILGGYHISALPETFPACFDVGVIGEGEQTLAELVKLRAASEVINHDAFAAIKGLCYRDRENRLVKTSPRELFKDIDLLPPPIHKYAKDQEWAQLFTARGCPYKCMYCASSSFWKKYRIHSAEYVVNEIERIIKDYGIYNFYFVDDLFISPKNRLLKIRDLLKEKGLLGRLKFNGFVRINMFDEEICVALKEMGFIQIRFGMETASEKVLKTIKDKPFTMEQVENVISLCNKYKLPVSGSFMFGIPGEEVSDIHATRDFLKKHREKFTISGFYILQPVPGSELWDICEKKELVSPNSDFSSFEVDPTRKDFDWNKIIYLNEDKISLPEFREIITEFKEEVFKETRETEALNVLNSERTQDKVNVFIAENRDKRVCFYGAGMLAEMFITRYDLSSFKSVCFLDKNKAGGKIKEYDIYSPDDLKVLNPDVIAISIINFVNSGEIPKFLNKIKKQHDLNFKISGNLFT